MITNALQQSRPTLAVAMASGRQLRQTAVSYFQPRARGISMGVSSQRTNGAMGGG